jgi:Zn-dependent protease
VIISDLAPKLIAVAVLLLFAFPVHEAAHAWMAYRQGDATAKLFGRISLDPRVHFDPVGALMTIVSVAIGGIIIGWAKPTPVNTANLRDRRNGEVIVALAGPVSNWIMAIAGAVVFRVLYGLQVPAPDIVYLAVYYFVLFNVVLGVFNLLPIPPLDGSTLLFRLLSPRQVWQIRPLLSQYGIFILLAIVILGGTFLSRIIGGAVGVLLGI